MKYILFSFFICFLSQATIVDPLQSQASTTLAKVLPDKIVFLDLQGKKTREVLGNFSDVEHIKLSPNGENYVLVRNAEIEFFNKNHTLYFKDKTTKLNKVSNISFINNKTPVIGSYSGIIDIFTKENGSYKKIARQFSELPIKNIIASNKSLIIEHMRINSHIGFNAKKTIDAIYELPRENVKYRPIGFVVNEAEINHSGFTLEKLGFSTQKINEIPQTKEHLDGFNSNRLAPNQRDLFFVAFDEEFKTIEAKGAINDYTTSKINTKNNHFIVGFKEENITMFINTDSGMANTVSGYGDIMEFDNTNQRVFLSEVDSPYIKVLDSNTGELIKELKTDLKGIRALKVVEDKLILFSEDGVIEKRNLIDINKTYKQYRTTIHLPKSNELKVFGDSFLIFDRNGERIVFDIEKISRCIPLLK